MSISSATNPGAQRRFLRIARIAVATALLGCTRSPLRPSPAPHTILDGGTGEQGSNRPPTAGAGTMTGLADAATLPTPDADAPDAPAQPTVARVTYVEADSDNGAGVRAEGFPALSTDGQTLVAMSGSDNLPSGVNHVALLFLNSRTGAHLRQIEVLSGDEALLLRGDPPPPADLNARVRQRVTAANAALEPLHLSPLPLVEIGRVEDGSYEGTSMGYSLRSTETDGLTVRRDSPTGPVILHRRLPAILRARASCRGANYPEVRGFVPIGSDRLLVRVGYAGNDSCWEGPDVWLMVSLPHG